MVTEEELQNMSPEEILELQKQNCIFCQMGEGKVPVKIVHDDENLIGILDIHPANPGHVLLFTKQHFQVMPQIPENIVNKMGIAAKKISQALIKSLQIRGTTILGANGQLAGQKAPHFILQIIPRVEDDGLSLDIPKNEVSEAEKKDLKSKILGQEQQPPPQFNSPNAPKPTPPKKESGGKESDLDKISEMFG